jgi:hypothetical protein
VKLKLDENLSARASAVLLEAGHDVSTVAQQKLQSATDLKINNQILSILLIRTKRSSTSLPCQTNGCNIELCDLPLGIQ